jgi:hypothetical protein
VLPRPLLREESTVTLIGYRQPNPQQQEQRAYDDKSYQSDYKIEQAFKKMSVHISNNTVWFMKEQKLDKPN